MFRQSGKSLRARQPLHGSHQGLPQLARSVLRSFWPVGVFSQWCLQPVASSACGFIPEGFGRRRKMVGERGFEPPAPASRRQCSTRLSYSPDRGGGIVAARPGVKRCSSAADDSAHFVERNDLFAGCSSPRTGDFGGVDPLPVSEVGYAHTPLAQQGIKAGAPGLSAV